MTSLTRWCAAAEAANRTSVTPHERAHITPPAGARAGSRYSYALRVIAALAAVIALLHLAAPIPYTDSIATLRYDLLWTDALLKQMSGYTALACFSGCVLLALRKRIPRLRFGDYQRWRLVHGVCGALGMVLLVVHSGLRLGSGVNLWLALGVLGTVAIGAANIALIVLQQQRSGNRLAQARRWGLRAHIVSLWPLPVLLGYHVIAVYYF
jgi:nitrite reductase (NADH) large subunit